MRKTISTCAVIVALVAAVALTACGSNSDTSGPAVAPEPKQGPAVKVGSYVDTEGQVIGSAIVQLLEANGITVVDKTKFGTPDVVRKAYLQGDLDAAIDYTGSGAYYVGPENDPLWSDAKKGYDRIKTEDLAANGIVWLEPAPANNTESIAVRKDFAEQNDMKTLADMAAYVNDGGEFKIIGGQAWFDRVAGLKGIQDSYGFTLTDDQMVGLSDGNTAQFIKALANGTDGVNAAEVYATDGGLVDLGLVVLEDPKSIPPVYNPTPVFRKEIIDAYPEIPSIIDPFTRTLTTETLQELNKAVAIDGQDPKTVARDYLVAEGFLE